MRARRHKLQVSTFPFLAVLLCAMGSLILVLLVMDRKAHQAAQARARREAIRLAEESAQAETARRADAEQKRRQVESAWKQKQEVLHTKLTQEQMDLALQMRTVREKLGEIAARLRYEQDTGTALRHKIQSETSRLQAEERLLATLRRTAGQNQAQSQESSKALRRMTLDLLQMEQVLKDLKAAREKEQHTFSVVPYHGRRGENRQPLYVECTAQGVIFHPERRAMPVFSRSYLVGRDSMDDSPDDVRGEVKRRIAQQRAKLAGVPGMADATPYLLLLVRPDGIETYSQLQHVLKDMILDFGYEFIDADWVLDFPADDNPTSAQAWMASARSSPSPVVPPAASGSSNNPHPIGLSPRGDAVALSGRGGVLGFRTGEGNGAANWLGGSGDQNRTRAAGTGPFVPGGVPGGGGTSTSVGGNTVTSRGGLPEAGSIGIYPGGVTGSHAGTNGNPSSQSGATGSPVASSGGVGDGSRSGYGGSGAGSGNGKGHGHPAAMAPGLEADENDPGGSGVPGGSPGEPGRFVLRGSGRSYGSGSPASGSPIPNGPSAPGLGSPMALSSGTPVTGASGGYGSGVPGLGQPGTGAPGRMAANGAGLPGNGLVGSNLSGGSRTGSPGLYRPGSVGSSPPRSGDPGMSISPDVTPDGRYSVARGNGGEGQVPSEGSGGMYRSPQGVNPGGQAGIGGSGGPEGSSSSPTGSLPPGTSGGTWQRGGMGGTPSGTAGANSSGQPGVMGTGNPGGSSGNTAGQSPPGQAGFPGPASGNGSGGSPTENGVSVYPGIDPLRPQPPPGSQPPAREANAPPTERQPEYAMPPNPARKKVILGGGGGSGEPGDSSAPPENRFATPSYRPQPVRKPAPLRPGWVHGGRDWVIYVECRSDGVVLYPAEKHFALADAASASSSNPLVAAIKQMIDRRQSLRRPGEPPYYPQVRLLVRPENVYTFLTVYPALETLPAPKKRQNLEPDDDVRDIVTDTNP